MIVQIGGTLASAQIQSPKEGQEFQAHQLLSILQITDKGAEIVKVKAMDLEGKFKQGEPIKAECNASYWANGNRGGISIRLIKAVQ